MLTHDLKKEEHSSEPFWKAFLHLMEAVLDGVFFADTFYWIALTNRKDAAHRKVWAFTATLNRRVVVTTDEVLTEFLAYCAADQIREGETHSRLVCNFPC